MLRLKATKTVETKRFCLELFFLYYSYRIIYYDVYYDVYNYIITHLYITTSLILFSDKNIIYL